MKSPLNLVIGLGSLVVLGAALLLTHSQKSALEVEKQTHLAELAAANARIQDLQKQLTVANTQKAGQQVESASEEGSQATAEAKTKPKTKEKDKNPLATLMKGLGQMMNTKEARAGFSEMTKGSIKHQFEDLFDMLQLDDAQKAALTELLSNAEAEQQAAGLAFFSGKTKEEMKQLATEMAAKNKASEASVLQLLGPEKFKDYKRYQDSKPDREQLAMLRGNLKSTDHPLTDDQEQQVLDTLYRERKAYPWKQDYSNDRDWDPAKLDTANMDEFIVQQEAYDAHLEGKLNGVLNPDQLEGLQKTNSQRRGMTKFGIGMLKGVMTE